MKIMKEEDIMQLNDRQERIVEIVKAHGPITGEKAEQQQVLPL